MTDSTQSVYGAGKAGDARRSLHSSVFDSLSSPGLSVARTGNPRALAAGVAALALGGLIVALFLNYPRSHPVAMAKASPAPIARPAIAAAPTFAAVQPMQAAPAASFVAPPPETSARMSAPSMIVDLSEAQPVVDRTTPSSSSGTTHSATVSADAAQPNHAGTGASIGDDQFAAHVSQAQADTAVASQIHDTHLMVPQGTVVPAILETGINSDLPGFVRAVVSRDVAGFDGQTVLIPRGSRLIGQYRSAVAAGNSRAFVVWSRLLTPDGVSIDIGSPATDTMGRGGLEGETNTHFFQRFGSAILLSVLTTGMEAAANSVSRNTSTAIVIGSPQQANNVAAIALQKYIDVPTTITVPQGTPLRVFVARDLDFSAVPTPKQ